MERFQERESVILEPPLQFMEGFFALTVSVAQRSNQFLSLSKMPTSLTSI